MSAPPADPTHYPAPTDGVQPQYQYVTPQQPGTPVQQPYYAQSPNIPQQQPVYGQSPSISPQPVYAQQYDQQQQPQQQYYAQPQDQPQSYVVTTTEQTSTEMPIVTGSGKGIVGKMPQLGVCCFFLPLHTGAMIIAFIMTIYYGYCGLGLLLLQGISGFYSIILIIFGILFLLVAVVSAYGCVGIYKEEPTWVNRFIKWFLVGSIVWFILEIVYMIVLVIYYKNISDSFDNRYYDYSISFPWAAWIVQMIFAGIIQYYFCVCLVSYQRVLHDRVGKAEKIQMA
ncbi:hypothetical protein BGX27_003816 [Mortierella sp. AM989]|nr:hypothetical protein BGX27_003816 [Mortierella sp. AM989]